MDAIDQIRAFNRATLRRVGEVEAAFRSEGVSLPEARLMVEVDRLGPTPARTLASYLGVNEGYLSRLISGLARRGLVQREVGRSDRRARPVCLTAAGRALADRLNAVSRRQVAAWFDAGGPRAAETAATHLRKVETLLASPETAEVVLTPLRIGDIGWLTQQHAEAYARDEGFDDSFEPLVARILADFAETADRARNRAFIARRGDERLGSIFCVEGPEPDIAKLRLFYLVPEARGLGLGRRLLDACLDFARSAGYRRMTLWTHESHRDACELYARNGFTLVSSTAKRSFGQDVVEQVYTRDL